jgi:dihydrofolate reductase
MGRGGSDRDVPKAGAVEAQTMGKIVLMEFVSLDGVVQAPGNDREDPEGFAHGGWTQPFFSDHRRYMPEILTAAGGYLLGRSTYEIFAAHWPTVTDPDDVLGRALNGKPKYVVSATLGEPAWAGTTVLAGPLDKEITAVKAAHKEDLVVIGSARLAHGLIVADLVDEYRLWLHPVVLGSGKRLFPARRDPLGLRLVDARSTAEGLVMISYSRTDRLPDRAAAVAEAS